MILVEVQVKTQAQNLKRNSLGHGVRARGKESHLLKQFSTSLPYRQTDLNLEHRQSRVACTLGCPGTETWEGDSKKWVRACLHSTNTILGALW